MKTLYRFTALDSGPKKINKHQVKKTCQVTPEILYNHGQLWRCRNEDHDFYGYDNIQAALKEEADHTVTRLYFEKKWLEHLKKRIKS